VVAERFLEESARVVGLDLDGCTVRWLDDRESSAALGLACDVADSAAGAEVIDQVRERFGRIDVLVNNAGILVEGLVEELTDDAWDRSFAVNVGGTSRCAGR
jgi:3-oxoacyl-[acyl-carrier protein] reductase